MTLADLRRQLENMLETRVQQNEVLAKISVTEDEGTHTTMRTRDSSRRRPPSCCAKS